MAVRYATVTEPELTTWKTGSIASTRQTDGCSGGPFVLLVSHRHPHHLHIS